MEREDRRRPGKIRGVLRLIDAHPAEIAYDLRERFGVGVDAVFDGRIPWDEAWMLLRQLAADPTSRFAAAYNGWDHPFSREAMVLADLYDLTVHAHTDPKKRRPKPYPRPFKTKSSATRRSQRPTASQSEIDAALRARGYQVGEDRRGH